MSYSWSETITKNTTLIKASHTSELHTNINLERAARGLGNYSFTQIPNQYANKNLNADLAEMRTALDEAHTENYCHTHYANHDNNDLTTHRATHNTTYYPGYDGTHYPGNDAAYYPGYDGNHWVGHRNAHYQTYLNSYNPSK